MKLGVLWCVLATAAVSNAEKWQWPEQASSVRIDTKVRFTEENADNNEQRGQVQADEAPFHEAAQTDGFYNRPLGAGRYPVRVESHPYRVHSHPVYSKNLKNYNSDGTLDSLQYCKCVTTPDCNPRHDSMHACGAGKYLCCYKRPNKVAQQNTEYFNEIDNVRPSLLPGREHLARPFLPPSGHLEENGDFGYNINEDREHSLLVGPGQPSGSGNAGLLVGPGGPTGNIGPIGSDNVARPPNRNPDILVGPEGPTGVIGPSTVNNNVPRDVGPSESAQRGILVGPGGPTGIIGPRGYGQRPVLVGPGGPTGFIGPRMRGFFNQYLGRQAGPGVLVGPGGPTGMIGPSRQLLVGPGGPTGQIGPQAYYG